MTIKEITKQLNKPFDPFEIEWRVQQAGESNGKKWAMVLAYVTNRAIMERLDEVFGIGGWQNEYQPMPDGGIICGIKCLIPWPSSNDSGPSPLTDTNGRGYWVTKYDGADKTNIEATKGGLSNAMKRAAVHWGIGRYLYRLDTTFVTLEKGKIPSTGDYIPAYVKDLGGRHYFARPTLPKFALPKDLRNG